MKGLSCVVVLVLGACAAFGQCEFQPYGITGARAVYGAPVDDAVAWFTVANGSAHFCVCRTADGGKSWQHHAVEGVPASYQIAGISALDASTAWVAMVDGSGQTGGGIFKTFDAGATWIHQPTAFTGQGARVCDVHFFDDDFGVAIGDPSDGYFEIYRTKDGGQRWTRLPRHLLPAPLAEVDPDTRRLPREERFSHSGKNGDSYWFATALSSSGRVIRTTDQGATWSASSLLPSPRPNVAFQDHRHGIAALSDGRLMMTDDGGVTWTASPTPSWLLPGPRFPAYVPGTQGTYILPGVALIGSDTAVVLAFSADGGATWGMMDRLAIPYIPDGDCDALSPCEVSPAFASVRCGWLGTMDGIVHWPGYAGRHLSQSTPTIRYRSWDRGIPQTATVSIGGFGTEPVTIEAISVHGSGFAVEKHPALPLRLMPWETAEVSISFIPTERGVSSAQLEVYSDAQKGSELVVKLSGRTMKMAAVDVGSTILAAGTSLYRIADGGAAVEICDLEVGEVSAFAVHPREKTLYGIVSSHASSTLLYIDPKYPGALRGATVPVGDVRAIAFDVYGRLFAGTGRGELLRVHHRTGSVELLGTAPGIAYSSLAFSPDGMLYASVRTPVRDRDAIYVVSTRDGIATLVGKTGDGEATPCIAFSASGELFGLKGIGSQQNRIIRIDPASGAATEVGLTGVAGLRAIVLVDILTAFDSKTPPSPLKPGELPERVSLEQNYPNPFNPSTSVAFSLPEAGPVTLKVYSMIGEEVATLVEGTLQAGRHTVVFDAGGLASGVYFARLTAGSAVQTRRMLLMR